MDLLNLLLGSMTSEDSVNALAQKTGASSDQAAKLIASSVPLLVNGMTNNASTDDGARSLAGALTQHTNTGTMVQQIADVDEEDGGKIVQHILGDESANVINALAQETQMDTRQVSTGLASLAPALMSVLSAVMKASGGSNGLDLGSLFGMFGGSQQNAASSLGLLGNMLGGSTQGTAGLGGMLGSLLGGQSAQTQQGSGLGSLLGGLLGGQSTQSQSGSGLGGMLGSLLGGAQQQTSQVQQLQQTNTSAYDGSQLLSLLSAIMK